jgi:N-acyl-D-aspartate/D-glutamate deacylase
MIDLRINGGEVVDGTGAPRRHADVAIDAGRVVALGDVDESARRTIDATGCVVAPGFVDLHTHYDAQLLWDPTASPSPLHGVTTVFGGNCGFSLAPAGEAHADYLTRMMARVEGIPLDALRAGVDWDWTSFGDYLDRLESGGVAVNAGFLAGHSAIRRVALGDEAVERGATDDEIETMVALLHQSLDAGALGFSTSQAHTHHDGDGVPVPSRAASVDELKRLAAALHDHEGTQLEIIVSGCINGFSDDEMDLLADLSIAAGRPVNWNVLAVTSLNPNGHVHQLEASTRAEERGGRVVALTIPQGMRIRLSFFFGPPLDALPGWGPIFGLPIDDRIKALSDPDVRRRLDEGAHTPDAGLIGALANWGILSFAETFAPENAAFEGRTVADVAAELGKEPFDALLDVVVADGLRTGLRPPMPRESADGWQTRAEVWRDGRAIIGGSDAGAHLDMMCGADYTTFMVGEAVRDLGLVSLEEAVHLISDVPARFYGLRDRGQLRDGWWADVVVFDPEQVGPGVERTRVDLPGGAPRLFADAVGVEHVLVNGTTIVEAGVLTDAVPGRVLRSGRDTETVTVPGA